jgi:hypothetical protein
VSELRNAPAFHASGNPVNDHRNQLLVGCFSLGIMQAAMGVFMIIASQFLSMLPLNTPGLYEAIGRFDHVLGLRYGVSTAFFTLAAFTVIASMVYVRNPESKAAIRLARFLAVVIQPWIAIALLIVAALWRVHYLYILGGLPSLELLFFAIGNFMLLPFSFYASAMILQDTRTTMRKGEQFSDDYEQRHRQYAAKGLFNGGIVAIIIGAALYGIGFILGYGLDATWPLFQLENYPMFMNVYAWFPVAFGIACMVASIAYYANPAATAARVLAWYCAVMLMLVPILGWFVGINLIYNLRETGTGKEHVRIGKEIIIACVAAALSIIIPLLVFWMIA